MVAAEALLLAAVVSGAVGRLITDADTVLQRQLGLAWNTKKELKKLKHVLSTIKAVLGDADEQQAHSRAMQDWLQKLQDAADEAGDFLSTFSSVANQEGGIRAQASNKVPHWFPLSIAFPLGNNKAHKIRVLREMFDDIANERKFHLNGGGKKSVVTDEEETDASLPLSEIYEREEALEKIVKLLIGTECVEELPVISIVGIRGIGKTTLAKLAYNDMRVWKHFNDGLMMWVWDSDDFTVTAIAQKIIQSATGTDFNHLNRHQTQHLLSKTLSGKKFLLVLDNVWNGKKWDILKDWLSAAKGGSKIIVTTGNRKVAEMMNSAAVLPLEGLSESACLSIFQQQALRRINSHPILKEIGKEIAKKSRGVPLAAKALGRLMLQKADEEEWLAIKKCEIWNLPEEENDILPALRSSYKHLPRYAERCLAYCSIFPRNYPIGKDKIIKLWMANRLIQTRGNKELEEVGHETFNHLLCRFFFHDIQKDEVDNITTFKVQGLIYDLARSDLDTECSVIEAGQRIHIKSDVRHLCCNVNTSPTIPSSIGNAHSLHTFLLLHTHGRYISQVPLSIFCKFKFLRALDLSYMQTKALPISANSLQQLRYFDISCTKIDKLPEDLCQLRNLQTLILRKCTELRKLPAGVKNMSGLRHLDITGCVSLSQMPECIGQLKSLKTLSVFIVGKKEECRIRELGSLDLRGKLHIRCLENIVDASDAEAANLKEKEHLRSLSLSWEDDTKRKLTDESILEALQPHKYLKQLSINQYMGTKFPSWISASSLQHLVDITLTNCRNCEHLPPLQNFQHLKSLTLGGMDRLKSMKEMVNLHDLKKLKIYQCQGLSSLQEGIKNLTSLESLEVDSCHSLSTLPKDLRVLKSLQSLLIQNCRKLMSLSEGLQHLTSLHTLTINGCPQLGSLPEGMQSLTSLQAINIQHCTKLASIPKGLRHITSLEDLRISDCPDLMASPEWSRNVTSLRSLVIEDHKTLQYLPSGMQKMMALEHLRFQNCHSLIELPEWLRNLPALKSVEILNCCSLKQVPAGLRNQITLTIKDCPLLKERSENPRNKNRLMRSTSRARIVDEERLLLRSSSR